MTDPSDRVVPLRFELSALVRRSVATLYSHLVTRPTGEAIRLGIERQIGEIGSFCVSVLDFDEVVVLDYSCADEMVAKLLARYGRAGAEVYFVARAVGETHRETIDAVLERHGLALVAELDDGTRTLLGEVDPAESSVWSAVERLAAAPPDAIAAEMGAKTDRIRPVLDGLASRRLVLRRAGGATYVSLGSLLLADG